MSPTTDTKGRHATKPTARLWSPLVLLLIVSACSPITRSGPPSSSAMFQVQDARLAPLAIVDLGDYGQLVLGRADYRDGRSRAWLARVNPIGNVEWQHELPLDSTQSGLSAGIAADRDGEAYVVGDILGTSGHDLQRTRLLIAKTRADGDLHWTKTVGLGLDTKAAAVVRSKGGEIVADGFVRDSGVGGFVFLASFNLSGDLSWQRRVAQAADQPEVRLRQLQSGGYLVSGSFGVAQVDAEGQRQWEYLGIDVVAALEVRNGIVVISAPIGSEPSGFTVHRLTADGAIVSTQVVLRDLCTLAGAWISDGERLIVAGDPCDREGRLRVSEVGDGGERNLAQITLPTGATASTAKQMNNGDLIVVGMFDQNSPNALKGWYLKVPLTR